jgi:hypothetical protein
MFVINPDSFLQPTYRISPFKTEYVAFNSLFPEDDFALSYFDNRFGRDNWQFSFNGREAIYIALEQYNLQSNDLVTIVTTSGNFYISSCVTKTIETFCRWNREILPETKVIFVNHEFGYPYQEMDYLVSLGIPIIEDCCTTFFSQNQNNMVGKYGDFTVYSLPKFFPIQIGGVLVKNTKHQLETSKMLDDANLAYIKNVIAYQLKNERKFLAKRRENIDYALEQFSELGFSARFSTPESIVPSALLLVNNGIIKDLNAFKIFLYQHGIQNSIFYGEDAFFIPCHQNLEESDINYFKFVIESFSQA